MELVLRSANGSEDPKKAKYQLCIDHQEGSIGFIVLDNDNLQIDFTTELEGWEQMKRFIDDSIYEYKQELREAEKTELKNS